MKKLYIVAIALTLVAAQARSQDVTGAGRFSCSGPPASDASPDPASIKHLFDNITDAPDNKQVADVVAELRNQGLTPPTIVDHLVGAYCPSVAALAGLSDAEKTNLVRRFARQVTSYVYTFADVGELSILIDIPLSPALLDRIDQAAKEAKISRDQWIGRIDRESTSLAQARTQPTFIPPGGKVRCSGR